MKRQWRQYDYFQGYQATIPTASRWHSGQRQKQSKLSTTYLKGYVMNLKCLFKGHDKKFISSEQKEEYWTCYTWQCSRCGKIKADYIQGLAGDNEIKKMIGHTDD